MAKLGSVLSPVFGLMLCFLLENNSVLAAYNGKLIGSLSTEAHLVEGNVYASSSNRLYIRGFTYDGSAPDAYVWMGNSPQGPDSSGTIIPANGSSDPLPEFDNADIRLDLPGSKTLADYKWISIWCRKFEALFGQLNIPSEFNAPAPHSLGDLGFNPRVHNVYASEVIILNHRQLQLMNLDYDGNGPDAYYWAGTGGTPSGSGFALADESRGGSTGKLPRQRFDDKDVIVTIPANKGDIFSIGHVGLWCRRFTQDFGHVDIPAANQLNVPVYDPDMASTIAPPPDGTYKPPDLSNCKVLVDDTYQVRWSVSDTMIEVALSARINPGTYMAFGLSGSDTRTQMTGSDVTVTWLDPEIGGKANAVDYYLSAYQQCVVNEGSGACTDELSSSNGTNDVMVMDSSNVNGIITISYTKPLNTGDTNSDKVIPTDRAVYISWAIGPINPSGLAAKHRQIPTTDVEINFGQASSSCPAFTTGEKETLPKWTIPELGKDGTTEFQLDIGQAGGPRGYEGITGSPGWGIAWYVNGYIIPVLILKRNVTYTFIVNGGNDDSVQANYHPFYITNDKVGGYFQQTEQEKQDVVIYAGPVNGSLCEWRSISAASPDEFDKFVEYRDAVLKRQCELPEEPVTLTWTPDDKTPDKVYYHCYTHKYLGWEINVVDDGSLPKTSVSILIVSMMLAMIMM